MSAGAPDSHGLGRKQQNRTLQDAEAELRLVSAALTEAQERERRRIAGELHDSIGQSLGAVATAVGVVSDMVRRQDCAGAEQMLAGIGGQVRQTIEEVRRIAMDLRPASLDDLGLIGTLSWFFREFAQIWPSLAVQPHIAVEELDIPAALRAPLFRVIQESLHNTVKHAGADAIRIELCRDQPDLVLRVSDNGRGFAVDGNIDSRPGGLGLTVMRNRVEMTGGCFHLSSEPGRGTTVTACWPLFAEPAAAGRP